MNLTDQLLLEDNLMLQGVDRHLKTVQSAQEKGRESTTGYGQRLLSQLISPIADDLESFCTAGARKYGKYRKLLKGTDKTVIAFITIKTILDTLHAERTATQVALSVGLRVEDEQRFSSFKDINPEYYATIMRDFNRKNTKSYRHMRNVLAVTSKKKGFKWTSWDKETRLGLGSVLLNSVLRSTDLIRLRKKPKSGGYTYIVTPTEEALKWVNGYEEYASILHPFTKPCVIQPDEWSSLTQGGYWSEHMRHRNPLIKGHTVNKEFVMSHSMRRVCKAVNAIQNTSWIVNTKVLDVMRTMWNTNSAIGLPNKEPIHIPKFRVDTKPSEMDSDTFKEYLKWKTEVAQLYTDETSRVSKAYNVSRVLQMAEAYSKYDEFWFVHQCDFRGRVYASSQGLNPQGPEFNKALLLFKRGKALGDSGMYWLSVHGANCFGIDKTSFDERVKWVQDHTEYIKRVCTDPLSETSFWCEADNPYMFLAFCFEYADAIKDPYNYVSHLPIGMDGSCNGLQHLSALLRDEIGGMATNLVPVDAPSDIYQEVANTTLKYVYDTPPSPEKTEWLQFADKHNGLPRKLAKRSVMTLPYGCTKYACFCFIEEAVKDIDTTFFVDIKKAVSFITDLLWRAIEEIVVSAIRVMTWLRDVARIASKHNTPLWWVNPAGFPVYQESLTYKSKQVKTALMGGTRLRLTKSGNKLNTKKQVQSVSPNFIHSLDSAHLMLTINAAVDMGITDFAMIHDDFGTHAADVGLFRDIIRKSFVNMYIDNDPLAELYLTSSLSVADLPPVPTPGTLDINEVLKADYFFA